MGDYAAVRRHEKGAPYIIFGPWDICFLPSSAKTAAQVNSKPIANFIASRRQYRTVALPIRP
jgi:hypothetical protein